MEPTEQLRSRFAGQQPKPRPTHTVVVPGRAPTEAVIAALLNAGEVFTVEPADDGIWQIGIFESAIDAVVGLLR